MNGKENVLIGFECESDFDRCVLIGPGLKSTKDNQLIIGNDEVQVNRELTDEEFQELFDIFRTIADRMSV
jgi:hypothetical protein